MIKVSICLLLNNDYYGTVYSFERSGFNIVPKEVEFIVKDAPKEFTKVIYNVEVELLVAYTDTTDKRLIEYFTPLATEMIYTKGVDIGDSPAYNLLFEKAKFDYVCILKPYVFLQEHWLTELVYYHKSIENSGVLGVCSDYSKTDFTPLPTTEGDQLTRVFIPKSNIIDSNGVCFFLRQHLFLVGAFDESCVLVDNEINQFQLRALALKLQNFYIPTQYCLILSRLPHPQHELSDTNLAITLAEMRKAKNYYIPLKTT